MDFFRVNRLALLGFLSFLLVGCGVSRSLIVDGDKITSSNLYVVDMLGPGWKYSDDKSVHSNPQSATIRDIFFSSCPGPKIISISRAVYRPSLLKKKMSFKETAFKFMDEHYRGLEKRVESYTIASHREINIGFNVAVEIISLTEEYGKRCDSNQEEKVKLKNKFILEPILKPDHSVFCG